MRRFCSSLLSVKQFNTTLLLELSRLELFALPRQVLALEQDQTMACSGISVLTSHLSTSTRRACVSIT